MDNIISRIIELDRQSDARIKEAQEEKERIISDARNEAVEIRNASIEHSKKHINNVEDVERKAAEIKINQLNSEKEKKIAEYNKIFEVNHQQWENEFVERIIG